MQYNTIVVNKKCNKIATIYVYICIVNVCLYNIPLPVYKLEDDHENETKHLRILKQLPCCCSVLQEVSIFFYYNKNNNNNIIIEIINNTQL